jgi:hypothetical protein
MEIREFVFGNRELQGPRSGNLRFADARAGTRAAAVFVDELYAR